MKKINTIATSTMALLTLAATTSLNAAIIDFEEIDNTSKVTTGPSLDTQGFNLFNSSAGIGSILHWESSSPYNADPSGVTFSHNYSSTTTTLTQLNGGAFNLFSIDFGDVFNSGVSQNISINAVTNSGSLLSTVVSTDSIIGLETFNLNWSNVLSASWTETSGSYLQLDNISVSAVPVPAAVWLFGSGLIGLIGVARGKKAQQLKVNQ